MRLIDCWLIDWLIDRWLVSFSVFRYLNPDTTSDTRFSYVPFGAGRHRCIGEQFAYVQIKTIWSILLQKYQFTLVDGYFPETNFTTMIHTPKNPIIRYKLRQTWHEKSSSFLINIDWPINALHFSIRSFSSALSRLAAWTLSLLHGPLRKSCRSYWV